ncbi:porin family protein [Pontimicrobium sp. MEBiC01747]
MNKYILTIALSFCTILMVNAQDDKKESNAGIKAGYNLASVKFENGGDTSQRHGFHVGFYGESFVSNAVALQVELLYSQQGYEIRNNNSVFTQKLNYINLPVLLKLYPTSNFYLEAGPQIGFAISHKEEFDSSFNLFDVEQEFDPNSFDYGANFGVGFKTESNVSLGVRYYLGLGEIYDDGQPKNRVLQVSLGFGF